MGRQLDANFQAVVTPAVLMQAVPRPAARRYMEALQRLYDAHKDKFHKGRASDMRFVE